MVSSIAQIVNEIEQPLKVVPASILQKVTADNWRDFYNKFKIDLSKTYKEQDVCLEIMDNGNGCRLGTLGNFSAVIGKAKSRKTFFVSFVVCFVLNDTGMHDKIRCSLPAAQKRAILFDTEQSQYDAAVVGKRILRTAQLNESEYFEVIAARTLTAGERLVLIENIIYNTPDLGILIIDGVRDLVRDINSPEEATEVTGKLMKWSDERNIHIIVVLHQNKGDNNARGHLGTEVINKAESVLSVEKEGDVSIVRPEYCRGKDFTPFAFSVDQTGLPYVVNEWNPKKEGKGAKNNTPFNHERAVHINVLKDVFAKESAYTYKSLLEAVGYAWEANGTQLSENKRVDYCKYYSEQGLIKKEKREGSKYPVYMLS